MPDGREPVTARVTERIGTVDAAQWDACAGGDNPFVSHAFLAALEDSGSVEAETGWLPQHLLVEDAAGALCAAAPMYLKGHSYGEYVFDHGWAAAYERAGGHYYPKLQVAVPFTPVPGPRLLVRPGPSADTVRRTLIQAMVEVARRHKVSSLHVTFASEADSRALAEAGLMLRAGYQFHWTNPGYDSFEDFLAALSSRKRKAIRKERREVAESGIEIRALTGDAIEEQHWDAFYGFYISTSDRKWGSPYLTREFFSRLGERMADRIVLVMAEDRGRPVAGALNLRGTDALYGRNWGCDGDYRFLHFEACYYQAIEYAIAHRLARVEAGAQGEHKIQRGYLPVMTHSAHWIRDEPFAAAVEGFLRREQLAVEQDIRTLADYSPFRRGN
ncbi:GNAT family N-acetyltransferase [Rhodospirillaceae bacterium SYSU D60014]|uniref:GNAT family N-acetyltransferase n=1 Tax=Virgifigura deserti TaxID=2268457 RepID=UPI000E66DC22